MSLNAALAEKLHEIAQMLELLGEDRFRINAHTRAARTIESLSEDIAELADDRDALLALDGIGKKVADKVQEYVSTGDIAEHAELRSRVPAGLLDLLKLQGLGPKTVHLLWKEKGVTDLSGLKAAIDDGSILDLPRMGEKTVENLREAVEMAHEAGRRFAIGLAMPLAEWIVEQLSEVDGVKRVAYAGSLRRGRDTAGDVDILVTTDNPAAVHEAFRSLRGVAKVLAAGERKSSIRLKLNPDLGRWGRSEGVGDLSGTIQADLRVVPAESWGAALMYFTGSKEHNVRLRERAIRKGCTLNEYGLYKEDGKEGPPQNRGVAPLAGASEEDVYQALSLPFIPPELREDHGELDLKKPPRLIEIRDIKAELHAHTEASDGDMPLQTLAEHARDRGFHTIAVTDHSQSSKVAGGLEPDRLRAQIEAVHEINKTLDGITVLAGSEVDILADGRLDYDDELLAALDVVVASPHAALGQDSAAATKRLIRAIEHPSVRILGHPTGRLIGRRRGLEPDMAAVYEAAAANSVALEINCHWLRLDLRDTHVRAAAEAGCLIAIDCDVHHAADFGNLRYGVLTARRGWLTPDRCVNTWTAQKLRKWLETGRV